MPLTVPSALNTTINSAPATITRSDARINWARSRRAANAVVNEYVMTGTANAVLGSKSLEMSSAERCHRSSHDTEKETVARKPTVTKTLATKVRRRCAAAAIAKIGDTASSTYAEASHTQAVN